MTSVEGEKLKEKWKGEKKTRKYNENRKKNSNICETKEKMAWLQGEKTEKVKKQRNQYERKVMEKSNT